MRITKNQLLIAALLIFIGTAWATTKMRNVALVNSTIDNTTIGGTTPAAGYFSNDVNFTQSACNPTNSTDASCTGTATISPAYADTGYTVECAPNVTSGSPPYYGYETTGKISGSSFGYLLTCTFNCSSSTTATVYIDCHTHHN